MEKPLNLLTKAIAALLVCCGLSISAFAQNRTISGTVVDSQNAPIIGASVMVANTANPIGDVTDVDGKFSLNVPNGSTLVVSFIGYSTVSVPVGDQTVFNIVLEEDAEYLEETVVIGYGVQKKSDVTGAIASVKSEDLANRTSLDPAQALQGKAAGVHIINASGAPGSESVIQIRGFSSNSKTTPLIIVDGLKVSSIDYLDPENIASMEVLKDAASAAIYGIEAGNGVILITTKTGQQNTSGKGEFFYNYQRSVQSLANMPELMNAREYMDYLILNGSATQEAFQYDGKTDTNWVEEMTEKGIMNRHTVGFRGGDKNGSLYVSLTAMDNDGIIVGDRDVYKRLTGQINADYKIKPWIQVGVTTSFERREARQVTEAVSTQISTLGSIMTMDPITPVIYTDPASVPGYVTDVLATDKGAYVPMSPNGDIYGVSVFCGSSRIWNPMVMRDKTDSNNKGFNVRGTAYVNFTPLKGLTITSRLGYRAGYSQSSTYNHEIYLNSQSNQSFSISGTSRNNLYYQWENFANYNTTIAKKHNISAMAGMSFQASESDFVTGNADKLSDYSENFRYLSSAINSSGMSVTGVPSESANLSYFGRIGYSYDNRYNIQANFRADAYDTSKLDKTNRWGYFPSISAGWNISNEKWMKNFAQKANISMLKVRTSYGINGNVNAIGSYQYASTVSKSSRSGYNLGDGAGWRGSVTPSTTLSNPNLAWETSRQLDLGLDLRMFRDKLAVTVDWYNKNTVDLITASTAPANTGATTVYINAGKVNNHGFEFEASWKDNIGDFSYGISGNFATLHNEVLEGTSADRVEGAKVWGSQAVTYFEAGYPLWYLRTMVVEGVDENGYAKYKDVDQDGVITANDTEMTGSGIPAATYGLTLNLAYKGFDFLVFGTGAAGAEMLFCLNRQDFAYGNTLREFYTEAWRPDNKTNFKYPRPDGSDTFYKISDIFVFDGSFFKIKQIQLGYSVPSKLLNKVKISRLRAYVSLDDWFTFTKYPGLDPEVSAYQSAANGIGVDYGSYPISKKLVFGVNISF